LLSPCNFIKAGTDGCKAVQAGFNYVLVGKPIANQNLQVSLSTPTVPVGGTLTVHASIAAPKCTYAMVNSPAHPRCWGELDFQESADYMPVGYSGYNPPRLSPSVCVIGSTVSVPLTTCSVKVLPPYDTPVLPYHYVVIEVDVSLNLGGDLGGELDWEEVALRIGPKPPCSGTAPAGQVTRAAEVSGAETCPLKVFVRVVGPIVNVGTRSGLAVDHKDGVVNFTVNTVSKLGSVFAGPLEVGQRCMSGCANLLVTVVDPHTGDPVPDATVTATLGQLGAAKSISGALAGEQFLCLQSDHPGANSCGTSLSSLSNAKGQLYLIYWAPGETAMSTSSISVTAQKCSSSCTAGQQEGSAQTGVTIMPYTIYEHDDGTISAAEIKSLITAVGEGKLYNKNHEAASEEGFELAIHWLASQDKAAKKLVSTVLGPVGYSLIKLVEVAQLLAEAHSGLKEEQMLVAALLEAVDMPGIGMFDEPFERDIPAEPNSYLRQAVISGLGLADGIGGGSGVLWDLGKALIEQYSSISKSFAVQPEHVDVKVDEISSCNSARPDCGPGYPSQSGIRPRLCLILAFSNHAPGNDTFGTNFCMSQYDPVAFAVTQSDLNTELPGS
jgi:hypothetical protein